MFSANHIMAQGTEKYIIGGNRGFLNPGPDELAKLEKVESSMSSNTKKEKFRRHCRRFWCIYLIANVIFLAIFLPVLYAIFFATLKLILPEVQKLTSLKLFSCYSCCRPACCEQVRLMDCQRGSHEPDSNNG